MVVILSRRMAGGRALAVHFDKHIPPPPQRKVGMIAQWPARLELMGKEGLQRVANPRLSGLVHHPPRAVIGQVRVEPIDADYGLATVEQAKEPRGPGDDDRQLMATPIHPNPRRRELSPNSGGCPHG